MSLIFESVHGSGEVFMDVMNSIIGSDRRKMLDLGCNHAPYTSQFGFKQRKYIDILPRVLDNKDEQQYFEQADAIEILNRNEYYDCIFSLDHIEHVSKEYGWEMILKMKLSCNKPILFTPLDPWMMTDESDKNPESHRSLWSPEDMGVSWAKIIFPHYHPILNIGAWFFWNCRDIDEDFYRVKTELNQKRWAKH